MSKPSRKDPAPPHWPHGETTHLAHCKVFDVGSTQARSPHTGAQHTFYRIDSVDWVNVVAVTPNEHLVMVRQFRHGSRDVTLEIPGGMVDPGEAPVDAAVRELLEETGYRGSGAESLGTVNPNPALFGNRVHSYVVRDAVRVAEIDNGETEETVVELVPGHELDDRLRAGEIDHSLVVTALYWYALGRRG